MQATAQPHAHVVAGRPGERRGCLGHDSVLFTLVIVTGINLPTLLDYLHHRDEYSLLDLADRLRRKGQDSIRVQRGQPA